MAEVLAYYCNKQYSSVLKRGSNADTMNEERGLMPINHLVLES
jgi:hypothetical protein